MNCSTSPELNSELDQIRCHVGSSLPSQKAPAVLLNALESTLDSSRTPVAYFAALITTLDQALKRETSRPLNETALADGAIIPATLYLLSVVVPAVPSTVLRSHLTIILDTLSPLFPSLTPHVPPLCSQIAIYAAVFPALESTQFSAPLLRQSFVSILELALDPRHKVRRKAQAALGEILASPPTPLIKHPYSEQVAQYVLGVLTAVENRSISKKVGGAVDTGVWCCGLLKAISEVWPADVRRIVSVAIAFV